MAVVLRIEQTKAYRPYSCYNEWSYKITSTRKLKPEAIYKLREMGFMENGQKWNIKSTCDGTETPVRPSEYEYDIEVECDSSG